jgi:PAS domain S-box-containing protein
MSESSSEANSRQPGTPASVEAQVQKLAEMITRSQHNYRELIDNLDQALFTISLTGEVRVANLRLSEIFGVSFQALIGHSLSEFIESPTQAEAERALPVFLEKGVWSGIVPVRLKRDAELHYFDCWLQTVIDDGKVTAVTGWARDVTTQRESEIRFAELFESLREGIFFTTPQGRILDANPAMVRMLGYDSKEDLQKHNFADMYANLPDRAKIIRQLEQTGVIQNKELVFRRKDGKLIHCLSSGFAIRDGAGNPVRLQGTLVDITERREIEERLHQEREFGRRLVECFPDMIAVLDANSVFTFVSDRVKEVLGLSPEQFLRQSVGGRTHPDDRDQLAKTIQDVIHGRQRYAQIEARVRHADGSWRTLRATASPLSGVKGEIIGAVASVRDVTESKRFEQQLLQSEKFAAMGQMMAGAAHELNNPLTAILGVGDLLRERAADESTRRQIDLVLQQARRAAGIVQNLLAFSRPFAQGRAHVRVHEILQDLVKSQQSALAQKNIRVAFEPPVGLPAVEGDRKLLSQALFNIMINAEQAITAAAGGGTLQISALRAGERVELTFADSGPGISAENISKIFDPFFTTKRPGGGSGLGLTISLAVIKEHGGTIEVQSTPGAGATFHVFLPIPADELRPSSETAPAAKAAPPTAESLRGHAVLIVDDEESIREIVQEGLSARGMQVDAVESAEQALARLAAASCEIILCDFNLPGISGPEFFERLHTERGDDAPLFVFMTGELVEPASVGRWRERGAWIVQKPFHVAALAGLLSEILQPQPSRAK